MDGDSYMTSSTPAPGGKSLPRCVISCPLGREAGQGLRGCPASAHTHAFNRQVASVPGPLLRQNEDPRRKGARGGDALDVQPSPVPAPAPPPAEASVSHQPLHHTCTLATRHPATPPQDDEWALPKGSAPLTHTHTDLVTLYALILQVMQF